MTNDSNYQPQPSYSPVQLVTDGAQSYLFHVRDGDLACAIVDAATPPSPYPTDYLSFVWREPFRGFNVQVDVGGALHCFIQTEDNRFLSAVSNDGARTWNYQRGQLQ